MGADLYIEAISNQARKEWQPKFDAAVKQRNAAWKAHEQATGKEVVHPIWGGEPLAPELQAYQDEVDRCMENMYPPDGYFRDSYNYHNVAHRIGFSWWQDIIPLCDDEGYIRGENLKRFLAIASQPLEEMTMEEFREQTSIYSNPPEYTQAELDAQNEQFRAHQRHLIQFINQAIEMGEPIYASL